VPAAASVKKSVIGTALVPALSRYSFGYSAMVGYGESAVSV
jgi:hypothetical protein